MSDKKIVLILIILVFCLGFLSYWHFQKFQQTLKEMDFSKNLPKIEAPKLPEELKDWSNYQEKIKELFPQLNP